ncbi:hypothetical protein IV203_008159 [Nitzschia inconspicua]|uniref:Uncharacterized protein n=1 Tax=Nitzschia inconspicua TaxID=303405 RepID=A0A9K3KZN9_9STRA|nr:hypothetical protein IV203_008159 [Nitzschia inconspicua]
MSTESFNGGPEVLYQEAATALFLAIEEMEWREAFDILQKDPGQARTWIRSKGTESTTFDWSVWRRLPIHEACRRQAPAWLVSELLSKFPQSAYMETNLGELPLHLAVDKACAPEVVNLIMVSNWGGIVAQDQAGRTPLDIIDRSELMQFEDYRIVYDSLSRCHKAYMQVQKAAQEEQAALKRKQKATFNAVSKRHQEEIRIEQEKHSKLLDAMEELKQQMESMKEVSTAKDHQIKKHQKERQRWLETTRDLEMKVAGLNRELESEKGQIKVLVRKIEQKEQEINDKERKIEVLSEDLRNIAVSNNTDIMECLAETEKRMRTMVSSQIALQQLLAKKSKDLRSLLKQRGISSPDAKGPDEIQDEKKTESDLEVENEQANAAMMAAAIAALQT